VGFRGLTVLETHQVQVEECPVDGGPPMLISSDFMDDLLRRESAGRVNTLIYEPMEGEFQICFKDKTHVDWVLIRKVENVIIIIIIMKMHFIMIIPRNMEYNQNRWTPDAVSLI
jgi:hypothetical protein